MNRESKIIICAQSPLQLMNAYWLTKKLNTPSCQAYIIDDEKSDRHLQMINLAKKFQMNYKLVSKKQIILRTKNLIKLFFSMLFNQGLYDCVILGDYRNHPLNLSLALKVKKNGKIFFVDDGNATIAVLQGKDVSRMAKVYYKFFDFFCMVKKISWKNYFTAYSTNYPSPFNIIGNESLQEIVKQPIEQEVFFLGTVMDLLAKEVGMEYEKWPEIMRFCFSYIKKEHPTKKIIYIPHGRDDSKNIESICYDFGIEIKKLDQCVEIYCMERGAFPCAIYGFYSSALYNLKEMNPNIEVTSFYLDVKYQKTKKIYDDIRLCYEKKNIKFRKT